MKIQSPMSGKYLPPVLTAVLPESHFSFSQRNVDLLCQRDPVLGRVIAQTGPIKRRVYPDPFTGLLRSILSQQISGKARDAIWHKLVQTFAPVSAKDFARLKPQDLRPCGISERKAHYMLGVAAGFATGKLDARLIDQMEEKEAIAHLTSFPGIGKWTAEMLLIFTFRRRNILSQNDLGIRKALCQLYGYERLTRSLYLQHQKVYSPIATLASFYLWEFAGTI